MWSPPKWEKTTRAKDETWEELRERKIDCEGPLTLVDIADLALRNNPSTRQAWHEARAAQTRIRQAESQWYPQLSASYQATFDRRVTNNKYGDVNQTTYTPSAQVQMLVLDLGGRAARATEAKQALISANFQYNQVFQDLLLDTEKAYYGYYSAQAAVNAALSSVEDAETTLRSAQNKMEAGLGVRLDVLQAMSDYEDAQYQLEDARGQLSAAKADLAAVMGFPADTELTVAVPEEAVPGVLAQDDISLLIEEALRDRPDISAQRASVRSKQAALAAANSDLWPTLNIGGAAQSDEVKYYGARKDTLEAKRDYSYSGYVSVNWDIFDGFYLYSKRNETKRLLEAERENLKQAELQASADVWTKYYNYKAQVQKYAFSKSSLESSDEAYKLALEAYNAGLKSIVDLLSAQSQLADSRSTFISSRKDLFVALAELAHSLGNITVKGKAPAVSIQEGVAI